MPMFRRTPIYLQVCTCQQCIPGVPVFCKLVVIVLTGKAFIKDPADPVVHIIYVGDELQAKALAVNGKEYIKGVVLFRIQRRITVVEETVIIVVNIIPK